jgi:hypothetical protein
MTSAARVIIQAMPPPICRAITSISGQQIPMQASAWRPPKWTHPRTARHPVGGNGTVR